MTKLMLNVSAAILSLGLAVQANAQYPNVDTDPTPTPDSGAGILTYNAVTQAQVVTSGTVVLGKNFVIQPGHYVDYRLGTTYDLDVASKVAISVLAANQNLDGSFIVPYFAAPGAIYTAVDLIDCSQFNYYSQGGDVVPVYGSHLVVRVYNLGFQPITYTQLTVHWAGY
jgi:hypothetical protein